MQIVLVEKIQGGVVSDRRAFSTDHPAEAMQCFEQWIKDCGDVTEKEIVTAKKHCIYSWDDTDILYTILTVR